jgi:hypothetical protein
METRCQLHLVRLGMVCAATLAVLVGCGSEGERRAPAEDGADGGRSVADASPSPDERPEDLALREMLLAACEQRARCCSGVPGDEAVATCVDAGTDNLPELGDHQRVDVDATMRCASAIRALTCEGVIASDLWIPECERVVIGTRDNGEVCESDEECANGYCGSTTCEPFAVAGEACSPFYGACGPGLSCDCPDEEESSCTCVEPSGVGQPCARDAQCASYLCESGECVADPVRAICAPLDGT